MPQNAQLFLKCCKKNSEQKQNFESKTCKRCEDVFLKIGPHCQRCKDEECENMEPSDGHDEGPMNLEVSCQNRDNHNPDFRLFGNG